MDQIQVHPRHNSWQSSFLQNYVTGRQPGRDNPSLPQLWHSFHGNFVRLTAWTRSIVRPPSPQLWHSSFPPALRIRDVYPRSRILIFTQPGSRISDPGSRILDLGSRIQKQQQKREVKTICCHTFFCSQKFHKIENYFVFEMLKKIIWAYFQIIIEHFTPKLSLSSQKYGFRIRDPRSGIRKKPILDPGSDSRGQKGTGSRIWIATLLSTELSYRQTNNPCHNPDSLFTGILCRLTAWTRSKSTRSITLTLKLSTESCYWQTSWTRKPILSTTLTVFSWEFYVDRQQGPDTRPPALQLWQSFHGNFV